MTEERDPRASVLHDLIREAGFDEAGHPAPERLFEYQEGLLTPGEAEEVRDHLALCPDCTRTVLELAGTVAPAVPEAPARLSEAEMEDVWPGIRERLPLPQPVPWKAPARRRPLERVALPLAASLLAATLALSLWVGTLLRDQRRLTTPRANVAVLSLAPEGEGVLREGASPREAVPRGAEEVLLILNLADLRRFPAYRAEILASGDGNGAVLWASDDLERSARGNFTLRLPLSFVPPGLYRIRLFGIDGGRREPLADYEVDLDAPK